ncbi:amino acid ABC transporter substrate-binding protein [Methylobacterium symbioticum]|uniref:Glutamate/aspartate import solute-binding protein n=1 Tax=Methylobacterium symbioticum TaxID=2584084 RepID=A0A509E9K4_9HYPH|nr:amino acid ABC transporter substrate-binding protein [Methylobacterium symbioticum]VUD70354.1 Glutamate/aspartate import solute-binding protein [Methylobacterium symbioticum]
MSVRRLAVAFGLVLLALPLPAQAVEVLTGALKAIAERGEVVIGYRETSVPFSFLDRGRPVGYAIDLCGEIVDEIGRATGRSDLRVRYERVTPDTRIEAVKAGRIDLECGSTTANAERRRSVAFSPVTYVSATTLLVPRDSDIRSYRDLGGRRVVVTSGTTNEAALRGLVAKLKLQTEILTAPDHAAAFAMVKEGRADAFATDDVLLYGLIADAGAEGGRFTVLPDKLSFEPYGIMFRKDDPDLAATVNAAFVRLAESRELRWIYERWFLKRLPNGERLNVPMSSELRTSFQLIGLED